MEVEKYVRPAGGSKRKKRSFADRLRMRKAFKKLKERTGRVPPSLTQHARTAEPFPPTKFVSFKYDYQLSNISPGIPTNSLFMRVNSCYDPDYANVWGNSQSAYFKSLCGLATDFRPYQTYKVISWRMKITVINRQSDTLTVIGTPPLSDPTLGDTLSEANNMVATKKLYLGQNGQSNDAGVLYLDGHIKDLYATYLGSTDLVAGYNNNPGASVFQGILLYGTGGTNVNCSIAMELSQYVQLSNVQL